MEIKVKHYKERYGNKEILQNKIWRKKNTSK